jgi:hypothetical protein
MKKNVIPTAVSTKAMAKLDAQAASVQLTSEASDVIVRRGFARKSFIAAISGQTYDLRSLIRLGTVGGLSGTR